MRFILMLSLLMLLASSMNSQNPVPATTKPTPPKPVLVENVKAVTDTCAFYVNLNVRTSDHTGLILNGPDLTNAMLYTRCDCTVREAAVAAGENFLLWGTYTSTMKVVPSSAHLALYTVWVGNTTKYLLTKK